MILAFWACWIVGLGVVVTVAVRALRRAYSTQNQALKADQTLLGLAAGLFAICSIVGLIQAAQGAV